MTNHDFILAVAPMIGDKTAPRKKHGNLLFENGVLYSYGPHFPLFFDVEGTVFLNSTHYSVSTAKHQSMAGAFASFHVSLNISKPLSHPAREDVLNALNSKIESLTNEMAAKRRHDTAVYRELSRNHDEAVTALVAISSRDYATA